MVGRELQQFLLQAWIQTNLSRRKESDVVNVPVVREKIIAVNVHHAEMIKVIKSVKCVDVSV